MAGYVVVKLNVIPNLQVRMKFNRDFMNSTGAGTGRQLDASNNVSMER